MGLGSQKKSVPLSADRNVNISISGVLVAFFIATLPLTMFQTGGFGSAQRIISIAVCIAALVILYIYKTPLRSSGGPVFWTAYAGWLLISVVWSSAMSTSFTLALGMLLMIATFVLMAMLPLTTRDIQLIQIAWLMVALSSSVIFLVYGEQATIGNRTQIILASGPTDSNEFSAYFLLPLAYLVDAIFRGRTIVRILSLLATMGVLYIILMTGSRSGAIASLVILCLIALWHSGRSFGKFLLVGIVVLLGFYFTNRIVWPLIPDEVRARLSLEALQMDSGSGREDIWGSGIDLLNVSGWRIISGFGPLGAPLEHAVMHNHFLQVLVDGGLIGLVLFIALIVCALRVAARNVPVFAATVGIILMFMTLTAYSNFRPAWAVLFMAMLMTRRSEILVSNRYLND